MHDERSKIMNMRIFSCGESAVRLAQQVGKSRMSHDASLGLVEGVTVRSKVASDGNKSLGSMRSLTCIPVKTNLPHWLDAATPTGVLKVRK
jgi:hypothetical protein